MNHRFSRTHRQHTGEHFRAARLVVFTEQLFGRCSACSARSARSVRNVRRGLLQSALLDNFVFDRLDAKQTYGEQSKMQKKADKETAKRRSLGEMRKVISISVSLSQTVYCGRLRALLS